MAVGDRGAGGDGHVVEDTMSVDITTISDDELRQDLSDSEQDINNCKLALAVGVTECGGDSVAYRLRRNREFVKIITAELDRRKIPKDACMEIQ